MKADNAEDAALGYVTIAGGALDLTAGTTGSTPSARHRRRRDAAIAAGDDAIHAETRVQVDGGTIDISRSYEGLEGTEIVITGGDVTLVAEDDGLNVAGGVDGSGFTREGGFGAAPGGGAAVAPAARPRSRATSPRSAAARSSWMPAATASTPTGPSP